MASFPPGADLLGGKNAAVTHAAAAREFYQPIIPVVLELRGKGLSLRDIARELGNRGVRPRYGCQNGWSAAQVRRVLLRAAEQAGEQPASPVGQAASQKMLLNAVVSEPTQHAEEPATADIVLWLDDESRGYFSKDEIRALWAKGEVTIETPYFREGMSGWRALRELFQ